MRRLLILALLALIWPAFARAQAVPPISPGIVPQPNLGRALSRNFLSPQSLGPSLTCTPNGARGTCNTANPITAITGNCTAAISGSTCNTSTHDDDQSTLSFSNTAANCAPCVVTLGTTNPVNNVCFWNASQAATPAAPNEGTLEVQVAGTGWTLLPPPGVATFNNNATYTYSWLNTGNVPFYLAPGGYACVQNAGGNTFVTWGYNPGSYFGNFVNTTSLVINGLVGFPLYHLYCHVGGPSTSGDVLGMQVAYGGTYQTTGYEWALGVSAATGGSPATYGSASDTAIHLTASLLNPGGGNQAGGFVDVKIAASNGTGEGYRLGVNGTTGQYQASASSEVINSVDGSGPSMTANLTGIQLYGYADASNFATYCWLTPMVQ